ncbi:MAG: DEAD/DEAH box helicase [Acidobacteria bacterium]|nr:DEAD/DEAH box helicase [Acidobacteriota bacterium]
MNFRELGLRAEMADMCKRIGFAEPTPIQTKAIPVILQDGDVIGTAETGTGKTAAFLLPIIQKVCAKYRPATMTVLVLAPTRELATQIEAECRKFSPKGVTCACLIGGTGYGKQTQALKRGVNILIATPGRLIDFMEQGMVNFKNLNTLVLDEADRMLDMGFLPAIKRIVKACPEQRQTLFFSATMAGEIEHIARQIVKDPTYVEASKRGKAAVTIEQKAYPVAHQFKVPLLLDLLGKEDLERVLIFTRTKRGADRIAHILERQEHKSNRIHGDRSQSQREAALAGFKSGRTRILVATDVAARGIDIDAVSHVINYDVPAAPEDYVHRIGRTGRAGNKGQAITFFTLAEEHSLRAIEKLTGQQVERVFLPDFGGVQPVEAAAKSGSSGRSFRSFGGRRRR